MPNKILNLKFDYLLQLEIRNNGSTPALKVETCSYYLINEAKQGFKSFDASPNSYLTPSSSRHVSIPLQEEGVKDIGKGSNNYFIVKVRYKNYSDERVCFYE